jgi:hypothetical protein
MVHLLLVTESHATPADAGAGVAGYYTCLGSNPLRGLLFLGA